MKPAQSKAIIQDCKDRGYIERNNVFYPPAIAAEMGLDKPKKKARGKALIKTGDIHDERNIRNKEKQRDTFVMLNEIEELDVWPEYHFTTERNYRLDYAYPKHKVGLEVDGGTWSKERSGHSSGAGLARDREKASLLASMGWLLIRVTPGELMSLKTIELIKQAIQSRL